MLLFLSLLAAQSCSSCHLAEWREHTSSAHARAFHSPSFQESWVRRRDPWCLECHLPAGIGCQECHGAEARTCASCHEFTFPSSTTLMQSTVSEHQARGGPSCQTCHMPGGSHAFPGVALAKDALVVEVTGRELRLTTRKIGHALPTGDPYRRLRISSCADLACSPAVDAVELGRQWRVTGDEVRALADTRLVPGEPRTLSFYDDTRYWRVELVLNEPFLRERKITLAEGEFP